MTVQDGSNLRYCSHIIDYEKKSSKITWLRCIKCKCVIGWLEDNRQRIEGKVVKLSYAEKEALK
ncbi:MAG: hypothetical protein ACRD93_03355 [Nitrososphaeraceae archaeon]